jgi:hypothetical protein
MRSSAPFPDISHNKTSKTRMSGVAAISLNSSRFRRSGGMQSVSAPGRACRYPTILCGQPKEMDL